MAGADLFIGPQPTKTPPALETLLLLCPGKAASFLFQVLADRGALPRSVVSQNDSGGTASLKSWCLTLINQGWFILLLSRSLSQLIYSPLTPIYYKCPYFSVLLQISPPHLYPLMKSIKRINCQLSQSTFFQNSPESNHWILH